MMLKLGETITFDAFPTVRVVAVAGGRKKGLPMADDTKLKPHTVRRPPNAGKGRPKGSPNKITADLKRAILEAAEAAGEEGGTVGYLTMQAMANPASFLALLGKVLPTTLAGSGENGEHLHKVSADDAFATFIATLGSHATGTSGGNNGAGDMEGESQT
jgi:hypothetical protein